MSRVADVSNPGLQGGRGVDQISVMGVHLEAGAPHVVFRTRTGRRRGRVAAVSALKSSIQFRNVGVYRHHSCQERRRSVKITRLLAIAGHRETIGKRRVWGF